MSELGRRLRSQVRAAVDGAAASTTNVVAAVNAGGESHVTSIQSDDEATVITRDGEIEVIRHKGDNG